MNSNNNNSDSNNNNNSNSTLSYARIGDAAYIVSLMSTLTLGYMVLTPRLVHRPHHTDRILDPVWKEHGFCITHPEIPFWSSHDVCLYVDVLAALLLYGVYRVLGRPNETTTTTSSMKMTNQALLNGLPGIVGHGIAHASIAAVIRRQSNSRAAEANDGASWLNATTMMKESVSSSSSSSSFATETSWQVWRHLNGPQALTQLLVSILFWWGMFYSILPQAKRTMMGVMIAATIYIQLYVPNQLGFTYVQSVIVAVAALKELSKTPAEKNQFSYALAPVVIAIPVTLVSWMESTHCSAFVRDYLYGHVVYDVSIPLTTLIWYVLCYYYDATITTKRQIYDYDTQGEASRAKIE